MKMPVPDKPFDDMTEVERDAYRARLHEFGEKNFRTWRRTILFGLVWLGVNFAMLCASLNGWGWWWFNIPCAVLAVGMHAWGWPTAIREFVASTHYPGGPVGWLGPVPWPLLPGPIGMVEIEIVLDDDDD